MFLGNTFTACTAIYTIYVAVDFSSARSLPARHTLLILSFPSSPHCIKFLTVYMIVCEKTTVLVTVHRGPERVRGFGENILTEAL